MIYRQEIHEKPQKLSFKGQTQLENNREPSFNWDKIKNIWGNQQNFKLSLIWVSWQINFIQILLKTF